MKAALVPSCSGSIDAAADASGVVDDAQFDGVAAQLGTGAFDRGDFVIVWRLHRKRMAAVRPTQDEPARTPGPLVRIPDDLLGREIDLGETTVTPAMVAHYAAAVGSAELPTDFGAALPAMFCLTLRRSFQPALPLPPGVFGLYGGHDIEFLGRIGPGETYRTSARIAEVYEKSGRSGAITVVVREVFIRDGAGQLVARITEREILRPGPNPAALEG
jgi:hypothetical protein